MASDHKVSTTFDQYMNEQSEDPGLAQVPRRLYLPDRRHGGPNLRDAVAALKVGEITPEVVESSYGYHIIMRTEPDLRKSDNDHSEGNAISRTPSTALDH